MGFSCDDFQSHPGVSLKLHLSRVAEKCRQLLIDAGIEDEVLLQAAELIGKCHDIAKYTRYFQERVRGRHKRVGFNKELYSHAPLSAAYTAWAARRLFNDPFLVASSMLCVYRHHGNLQNSLGDIHSILRDILDNPNYRKQIDSLYACAEIISAELNELGLPDLTSFLQDFKNGMRDVNATLGKASFRHYDISDLYIFLLLFSVLIDSDKKEAAELKPVERKGIPGDAVDRYVHAKFRDSGGRMARLRGELYKELMGTLDEMLCSHQIPRIMTLTAPTGSGKTLLALSVALKLREKIYKNTNNMPRIIYVLPYINIIEQTHKVFSEVLGLGEDASQIELLLKHHHLYYPRDDLGETPLEEKLMLMESWESEIVVTTFVQFLETLIGTRNSMLKKFHKLFGSIIILDEVQTIPVDYWLLVKEAIKTLSRYSYIILMTATMPTMLAEGRELVRDHERYFGVLDRVTYIYEGEEKTLEEAADFILNKWDRKGSVLAVVNTISTSIELYRLIRERLGSVCIPATEESARYSDNDKVILAYLSTNIIPRERLRRILLLKDLLEKRKRVICVSTQVIEAGVDLDFDKVVRDIAPFDSIIQAGGRCNRNWTEKGMVYIIKLRGEDGNLDSTKVYGRLTIHGISEPLLSKWREWSEDSILECIKDYYRLATEKLGAEFSDDSRDLLEAIKRLDFEELRRFKLIRDEPKASVFIEIDQTARAVLEDFRKVWGVKNGDVSRAEAFSYRALLRAHRARMEDYIVETYQVDSLPEECIVDGIDIRYIPLERVNEYYDRETGLRRTGGIQACFW